MHRPPALPKLTDNELQQLIEELTPEQQQELLNRGREMLEMKRIKLALAEIQTKLT